MSRSNDDMHSEARRLLQDAAPSETVEVAGSMKELYDAFRHVGFSQPQALWIVGFIMSGGGQQPQAKWEQENP